MGCKQIALLLFLLAAPQALAQPAKDVSLTLAGDQVVVADVTPGGRVVFLGFGHERRVHILRTFRQESLTVDGDRDGRIELEAARLAGSQSVLAAVDLETGGLALGRIDSVESRALAAPRVGRSGGVGSDALVLPGLGQVEAVLVRPARPAPPGSPLGETSTVGAWGIRAGDGSEIDDGGLPGEQDGVIVVRLAHFRPIGGSEAPPKSLEVGDIVVVIDPLDLAVGAFALGAEGWVAQ